MISSEVFLLFFKTSLENIPEFHPRICFFRISSRNISRKSYQKSSQIPLFFFREIFQKFLRIHLTVFLSILPETPMGFHLLILSEILPRIYLKKIKEYCFKN